MTENSRVHGIQTVARSLAEAILLSEPHDLKLHDNRWKDYRDSLNPSDRRVATKAFINKLWGLNENGQSGSCR